MTGRHETFGKYRLNRRLATGGMAEVFLGTVHGEAGFVKPVVIKRLHPRLSEDRLFAQMLIDEARITSQLSHTNICQVLDLGTVDGSYFLAMEHIAGEDLRTLQAQCDEQRIKLPVKAALYVLTEVLAGLDYAHAKQDATGQSLDIIHRDISPQNILISYEGEVKIIDFGIAKARSRLVQTEAGIIKGKYRYMSPEQATGQAVDHRTDIFAAGVVLYEMLRGEPHGVDISKSEMLRRVCNAEFESLRSFRSDLSRPLLAVVSKALQLKPKGRFFSAADFRTALMKVKEMRVTFGRSELGVLMRRVFDEERRWSRSGHPIEEMPRSARVATLRIDQDSSQTSAVPTRHERPQPGSALTTQVEERDAQASVPTRIESGLEPAYDRPAPASEYDQSQGVTHRRPDPAEKQKVREGQPVVVAPPATPARQQRSSSAGQFSRSPQEPGFYEKPTLYSDGSGEEPQQEPRAEQRPAPAEEHRRKSRLSSPVGLLLALVLGGGLGLALYSLDVPHLVMGWFETAPATRLDSGETIISQPAAPIDAGSGDTRTRQQRKGARLGLVHVKSQPPGGLITLCGRPTKKRTPALLKSRIGKRCTLEIDLPGHETFRIFVKAHRRRTVRVEASLTPDRPARPDARLSKGALLVTSIHAGTVYINGKNSGRTPRLLLMLSPGIYAVEVHLSGLGSAWKDTVRVRAGKTTKIHVDPSNR